MHLLKSLNYNKYKTSRNCIRKPKKKKILGQQIAADWKLIPKDSLEVYRKRLRRQREQKKNKRNIDVFLRRKRYKNLKKCKHCKKRVSSSKTDLSVEAPTTSVESDHDTAPN